MDKKQFLTQMEDELKKSNIFSEEEIQNIVQEYENLFIFKTQNNEFETDLISEFGNPLKLARKHIKSKKMLLKTDNQLVLLQANINTSVIWSIVSVLTAVIFAIVIATNLQKTLFVLFCLIVEVLSITIASAFITKSIKLTKIKRHSQTTKD